MDEKVSLVDFEWIVGIFFGFVGVGVLGVFVGAAL